MASKYELRIAKMARVKLLYKCASERTGAAIMDESGFLKLENITHKRFLQLDPKRTVVAVAIGPLEMHGPHLPIGLDLFEAYALLERGLKAMLDAFAHFKIYTYCATLRWRRASKENLFLNDF
jgi:hypothetical protein